MKKNLKTLFIILSLLLSGLFFSTNFGSSAVTPIQTQWWLGGGEGYAMNVTKVNFGGATEFPGENDTVIREGEILFLWVNQYPADWFSDPYQFMNVSQSATGGVMLENVGYYAPWVYNASDLYNETAGLGPTFMIPAIPIPSDPTDWTNYYTELSTEFTSNGFTVTEDDFYMRISANNLWSEDGTFDVETTISKYIGLMHNYTYSDSLGNIIQLEFFSALSPMNYPASWHTEEPILSYDVLQAQYTNGTQGFSFEVENPSGIPYEPQLGQGMIYNNQLLQVNLNNFSVLNDGPSGYEMELFTETGWIFFDTIIELPSSDPRNNTFYLYPLFPVADRNLINAYFALTLIAGHNYSYSIVGDLATVNFNDGNDSLTATWDLTNGVLQYWKLDQRVDEANTVHQILELSLISFTTITAIDPYWGQSTRVAHNYVMESLNNTSGDQIDLSNDNNGDGYIAEGDLIYFELINNSVFDESAPLQLNQDGSANSGSEPDGPIAYYNMGGPNGGTTMRTNILFPGDMNWDGPPMLYPHMLLGTAEYYSWFKTNYGWAGATFDNDSSKIWFDWNTQIVEGFPARVYAEWDKSTGVLQEYLVTIDGAFTDPEAFEMHLVLNGTGIPSYLTTSSTTSSTTSAIPTTAPSSSASDDGGGSAGLPFSEPFIIIFGLISIPVIRKRVKIKL